MRRICDENCVLLDAGPFFRFADAGKLREFAHYLGERAQITVAAELELRGKSPKLHLRSHPSLQNLDRLNFPAGPPVELEPELVAEVEMIRSNWAKGEGHPHAHRGEISTVLLARKRRDRLVVIDDVEGLKLAAASGIPTIKTTHVVAEMAAAGALGEQDGYPIFRAVRRQSRKQYEKALAAYRDAFAT